MKEVQNSLEISEQMQELVGNAREFALESGSYECTTAHLLVASFNEPLVRSGFENLGITFKDVKFAYAYFFGKGKEELILFPEYVKLSQLSEQAVLKVCEQKIGLPGSNQVLELVKILTKPSFEGNSKYVFQKALKRG